MASLSFPLLFSYLPKAYIARQIRVSMCVWQKSNIEQYSSLDYNTRRDSLLWVKLHCRKRGTWSQTIPSWEMSLPVPGIWPRQRACPSKLGILGHKLSAPIAINTISRPGWQCLKAWLAVSRHHKLRFSDLHYSALQSTYVRLLPYGNRPYI